jgi:hypothetical protein
LLLQTESDARDQRLQAGFEPATNRLTAGPTLDLKLDAISVARGNQSRGSAAAARSRCHVTSQRISRCGFLRHLMAKV